MSPMKILMLVALISLNACTTAYNSLPETSVAHVVLVWMTNPGNAEHRQKIMEASRQLGLIEGVGVLNYGESLPSDRKVVDDSFDVALYFEFTSEDAMNAYTADPLHVKILREQIAPLTDHYIVYDFNIEP
jgi:hypothetical protein